MLENGFEYSSFDIGDDRQTVNFRFKITHDGAEHELAEVFRFPVPLPDTTVLQPVLKALHLALGISYYKIFADPVIKHPYSMDSEEAEFWNDVFVNGLGEYLYINKLPRERLAKFSEQPGEEYTPSENWQPDKKALLGIGGGKDSIVAGELLKKLDIPLEGFVMATGEQLGQSKAVAETMQIGLQAVERTLDKQLLELQEGPGAFKGHVPISLVFALTGSVLAVATGSSWVIVANENSSSIPRAEWEGEGINHQWSKSFGFEKNLQEYLKKRVSPELVYFSAIRPLSSVAVARLFARFPDYFEVFTSDNTVFRIDPAKRPHGRWSLESPKSLSSFMLLSPWMNEEVLLRTFGRDFLNEPSLEKLFYELTGLEGHQPLDCVGTVEELVLSLNLAAQQGKFAGSYLMHKAIERNLVTDKNWQDELVKSLEPAPEQAFPPQLSQKLTSLMAPASQDLDAFEGKDVVFVGAGKGRAMAGVQEYLEKHANIKSFSGVDKQDTGEPLGFLKDYDPVRTVFIKNEGIPGQEMPVPYTTALQLFFDLVRNTHAKTVGITGTKGKSTTASLVAHILKSAGKDVILAGNIGASPLPALDQADKDTVFVLELSSYQLSDLHSSPHISTVLNLYNDHTDWHGSLDEYWEAKHNIMRYAGMDDLFIYNPDFDILRKWASEARCRTQAIDPNESYELGNSMLYGEHNKLNVKIARAIAREFGISDDITHQAVLSFKPLEHRMEYVGTKQSRVFINDAIGMTPESTLASLQAVSEKYGRIGCLLLGGKDRNYNFATLLQKVTEMEIPALVLFPDTEQKMKRAMPDNYQPKILETSEMSDAVKFAAENSPPNSVVLLSTAAPSYSVWKDFEDKGTQFKESVSKLLS